MQIYVNHLFCRRYRSSGWDHDAMHKTITVLRFLLLLFIQTQIALIVFGYRRYRPQAHAIHMYKSNRIGT